MQYITKDEQTEKQCSHMHTRIEVMYGVSKVNNIITLSYWESEPVITI